MKKALHLFNMKKLITILAIILLASCRDTGESNYLHDGDVITEKQSTIVEAIYTSVHSNQTTYQANYFVAPSGLYNVGDTIHFIKR